MSKLLKAEKEIDETGNYTDLDTCKNCNKTCPRCFRKSQMLYKKRNKLASSMIITKGAEFNLAESELCKPGMDNCEGCKNCLIKSIKKRYDNEISDRSCIKITGKLFSSIKNSETHFNSNIEDTKNSNLLVSVNKYSIEAHDCLTTVSKILSDNSFRSFYDKYFSSWSDTKSILMLMNSYIFIENTILNETGNKPTPDEVKNILKNIMMNSDYRKIITESMSNYMENSDKKFDKCIHVVKKLIKY